MHIHKRIKINCTSKALWRCLTELELQKQWISQLVDETPDEQTQAGVGARSTIQMREGTNVVTYLCVVTAWEPERRLGVRLSGGSFAAGMEMDVIYELTSGDYFDCTQLDYDVHIPLKGMFKLMAPMIWLMSVSNMKKDMAHLSKLAPTVTT